MRVKEIFKIILCIMASYYYFGLSVDCIVYAFLWYLLLSIAITDYHTMRIPNRLIILGMIVGIFYLTFLSFCYKKIQIIFNGIKGFLLGYFIIGAIMLFSLIIFKKEGMGMGDLKLLGMIGLFLGSRHTLYTIFIAIFIGGVWGTILYFLKKKEIIPFAPFLAIGTVVAVLWGDILWSLYLN